MLIGAHIATAQPQAQWLSTTHSFGAFDEDLGKVTTYFKVVNVGDKPLSLLSVRASCGCTTPTYSNKPIAPGDTGQVVVTYNPAGRPGKFDKKVKVETNASSVATVLTIKGVVIGDKHTLRSHYTVDLGVLKLKNSIVQVGEVTKGRVKTAFLDGYNQSSDTIRPTVSGLPEYVLVDVAPHAVPPGEQVTFTFFYDSSKAKNQWGLTNTEFYVKPDTKSTGVTPLSMVAIVNEDFSNLTSQQLEKAPKAAYSTASIDLGRIARGNTVKGELLINNYGKESLIIRRIVCLDDNIKVKCSKEKVSSGSQAKVTVSVDTSALPDSIVNSRITVITNDPARPSVPIRIVGELTD
jgi:hypothetical protein